MISEDTIRSLSHIFCGDEEELYSYKSGPQLIRFFNSHFNKNDVYQQGFPSRWIYVYNNLIEILNNGIFDKFLNIILSKEFIIKDSERSNVEAAEHINKIFERFNKLFNKDQYIITYSQGKYHLGEENTDLILIGSGGFANVYKQKSTGLIIKKLKEDFLTDIGIRSRFKREFEITKSLQSTHGIIEVYTFDENKYIYTMEEAEKTLEKYLNMPSITDDIRINCIRQILYIMNEVHEKDIIHRDLSPNNIFIINGMVKIADFGLGKDLKIFTSHQSVHTNSLGQYSYCAPEQFMLLKDGDKRSDVYSLGRLINFIMTGNPTNSHHIFRSVSEKATNNDASYRYADAKQLSVWFEKSVEYHKNEQNEIVVLNKMNEDIFDDDVERYIYELDSEKICQKLLDRTNGFYKSLLIFMASDEQHAQHIIKNIDIAYQNICGKVFDRYDIFARFSYDVLKEKFSYVVKEIASNILRYVAVDVNRFSAQHLVEEIKRFGIEPMLEDILDS